MKDPNQGDSVELSSAQTSSSAPDTPENADTSPGTVSGDFLQGGPLWRVSLGALFRFRSQFARPAVRIWLPILGKGLGTVFVLSCVAALGHQSREEEKYGQLVEPEAAEQGLNHVPAKDEVHGAQKAAVPQASRPAACPVPPPCAEEKKQGPAGVTKEGLVILNEANADELTRLPGVGKSRAEKIVALRTRLKGFRKVSDLLRIRGIGWRTLQKMKDKIVLNRPAPTAEQEGGDPGEKSG